LTEREFVLDASALLAMLQSEPGNARVLEILDRCVMHTVNVAEVIGKLVRSGVPLERTEAMLDELHLSTEPRLDEAGKCGGLLGTRRDLGLSLGDCVCLTTAACAGAVAVTADRRWKGLDGLDLGGARVRVEVLR
jgi:PIN domain nuclease of toxin-antitoxin system